jgi:ABC-2 type transport system permease protein
VVRREFIERVRTKWFLIGTVLGPIFMIALTVLPGLLTAKTGRVNNIVLLDEGAGFIAERLSTQLQRSSRFIVTILPSDPDRHEAVAESLTAAVQRQELDGFATVSAATVAAGIAEYRGRNVSSLRDMSTFESALKQVIVMERLGRQGIDPAVVQEAQSGIDLRTLRITRRGATGESGEATFFLGYFLGLFLYMVILLYGVNVMRSILEEKQNRIIEVLVSSLRPFQLMVGKVIGVAGVGLFQFAIWGLAGWTMIHYRGQILGWFKVSPEAVNSFQMPAVGFGLLLISAAYFLLGYLLYSSLFAMVGSTCTTESEAQQAQQPVMFILIAALMILFPTLNDPSGQLAVVSSMIPFTAPIIMPIRVAASDVPGTEIAMSIAITFVSALVVVWISARIYRIGILMYGKRPSMKEIVRWARQS